MAQDPNYRKYETVFILRTDLTDDDVTKIWAKIDSVMAERDGHEIRREDWGPSGDPVRHDQSNKEGKQHLLLLVHKLQLVHQAYLETMWHVVPLPPWELAGEHHTSALQQEEHLWQYCH